jgi:hypothetical protein
MQDALPNGWTQSRPGGIATSSDPDLGGIIDQCIADKTWFIIFNSSRIETIEGLPSRAAALEAYAKAIGETYWIADTDTPQDEAQ